MKIINYQVRVLVLLSFFLFPGDGFAQRGMNGVLIRGKVSHASGTLWELNKSCNFYTDQKVTVQNDTHGDFSEYIPIDGETQDFHFPGSLTITVMKNDTLNVSWDNDNIAQTLISAFEALIKRKT